MTEVKLPEGTTIESPAKEKQPTRELRIPQFAVAPDLPQIVYPHYTNNNHTELSCLLIHTGPQGPGSGQTVQERGIPKDPKHPLYADIKKQFSEEEILHNTRRETKLREEQGKAVKEDMRKQKQSRQREQLWEMKQEFLNMDLVKQDRNKHWRRKIRKATTVIQAQAYGIACIIEDAEDSE